jgi:large subunit ribosomal protein L15
MNLSNVTVKDKTKKVRRVGRGTGSGRGKTSSRGHKGAGQRKGRMFYIGYQGGNVPYLRKIPKRGFTSKNRKDYQIVNLEDITRKLKKQKEITPSELKKANLIEDEKKPVKILARLQSEFSLSSNISAHKFSRKAKELIEKAGGTVQCLKQ